MTQDLEPAGSWNKQRDFNYTIFTIKAGGRYTLKVSDICGFSKSNIVGARRTVVG